ncbi:hypothetical protein CGLO_13327 [Colletotrichum gloeosporioides Cg-14]|uniref:Uncharacterized protein n=1 Tax=Colletotrichum gloeosporioides (strain Cg-14) TaxID=1237896 RepID=T0JWT7_COLGC|nr:hypothetical protein CGLO_13327 [Colletotrichum gloeosporioides Cg-14]
MYFEEIIGSSEVLAGSISAFVSNGIIKPLIL